MIVDTTNFTDKTSYNGSRDNLHLVERFTRVAPDIIMYEVTLEDPTVWASPWTVELPLTEIDNQQNQIFEAACHEGNYAMTAGDSRGCTFAGKVTPGDSSAPGTVKLRLLP